MAERIVIATMNGLAGELTVGDVGTVTRAMELDADHLAEIFAAVREPTMSRSLLARELVRCAKAVCRVARARTEGQAP